ncbi:ChbG/HpnK family deacetylase [Breznakiella homolactica]|uniref:ChbG/HpnK family deacetylase n=1 Tax=Breznakiella homolactica TaxID=2798577 RepID=A0A7T8BB92_9SPIR|nr:ChbG/HpnK family deacetylase [Breznakiella homolactica]QQO09800.1 ChbG/HpnK family deacetylase [Breznakiella homolactica]
MGEIFIHADDFAVSEHASQDILDLCSEGLLDSISVIPNLPCFGTCAEKLRNAESSFPHTIKISVHLNLLEGTSIVSPELLPDLADGQDLFKTTWISLFLYFFTIKKRKHLRKNCQWKFTRRSGGFLTVVWFIFLFTLTAISIPTIFSSLVMPSMTL